MKNFFAFLMLFIWLAVGCWFYACKVKNLCDPQPQKALAKNVQTEPTALATEPEVKEETIEIIDPENLKKAYLSVFTAEQDLGFKESQKEISYTPKFDNSLDQIADFLKKHKQTQLTITGFYANNETNDSGFENLGLARIEQVKKLLLDKGVLFDQLILKSERNDDLFKNVNVNKKGGEAQGDDVIDFKYSEAYKELNETDVKSAYKALFKLQEESKFRKNDTDIALTETLEKEIQKVIYYLNRNKDQGLEITAKYEKNEDSGIKGQNIGLLRAYNFKQKLIDKGIDPDKIRISSRPEVKIFDERRNSMTEAMQYNFIFPDKSDESKLAELMLERDLEKALSLQTNMGDNKKKALDKNPNSIKTGEDGKSSEADIFFDFGSDKVKVDKNLTDYVARLQAFLKENPSKRVSITGHTCNIGNQNFNYYLGQRRADAAKKILMDYGIDEFRLLTFSQGEQRPVYDNTTEAERSKNRRVEIDIQ